MSGAELQRITAATMNLVGSTIVVDNVTADNSNNIGTVTLASTGSITFQNAASTFNALTANANVGIHLDIDLSTDTGALSLNGDANGGGGEGFDEIELTGNRTITAQGDLTLASNDRVFNDTDGETITLTSTAGNVTINGGRLMSTNGTIQINGATFYSNLSSIQTDYNDLANGADLDINAAVVLQKDVEIDTDGGTDGTVDFSSTVDGGFGLTIESDTGTVTFNNTIGGTTALSALTVNSAAGTGAITLADIGGGAEGVTGATAIGNANTATLTFTGTTYKANQQTYSAAAGNNIVMNNVGAGVTFTSSDDNIAFNTADLPWVI